MSQLETIRPFQLTCWEKLEKHPVCSLSAEMFDYAAALKSYNQIFEDFRGYEQWYLADINRQTREKAKMLELRRESVETKLRSLEEIISRARAALEKQLKEMRILK